MSYSENIRQLAIKKARKSICRYKISALGFDKNGVLLGTAFNKPRFSREAGGTHAEMALLQKYGRKLKSIVICRVNRKGALQKIEPCSICKDVFYKLGITIHIIN